MYRNNVKNANRNIISNVGIYSDRTMYLDGTSTTTHDEISRSLKLFAMLTAYTQEEPTPSMNQIDDIMQDFACNGYSSDDQTLNQKEGLVGFWRTLPFSQLTSEHKKYNLRKYYNNGAKTEKYSFLKHCVFCENNNEPDAVVRSHAVRDALGRVLCPKLRVYICPICKASGDLAHTVKYCPQKPIITMEDAFKGQAFRFTRNAVFRQHMKI